jgi:hypothetical protein
MARAPVRAHGSTRLVKNAVHFRLSRHFNTVGIMRIITSKLFALLWMAVAVAGCTSTSTYREPIAGFSAAADKAATAFQALDSDATAQLNGILFQQAAKDKRIQISGCTSDSDGCTLTYGADDVPVYVPDLMPNTVALLNGIRDYADALDDLEKADATKDVEAATGKAVGSAATVAGAVNAIAGTALTSIAEPVGAVVGYGYGLYQDNRKHAAMVRAVTIMDGVIQGGRAEMATKLKLVQTAKLDQLQMAVAATHTAFLAEKTPEALTRAINAAKAMDAVIKAGLPDLYDKLAEAHAKLKDAVTHPDADPAAALNAISAFLTQAQHVKDIADKLATHAD